MKKSLTLCCFAALLVAAFFSAACVGQAEDLSTFVSSLESEYYVQQGTFAELDTLELASEGKLTSCFGNNNGSSYQVAFLPPAPEQDAAAGIPAMNWADETPTIYDDPAVENHPANPYFAPVGWSFKLRTDEVIVLSYDLPPQCKYFSIGPYLLMTASDPTQDLSYDNYSITVPAPESVGGYNVIFASLGDQLNHLRFKTVAESSTDVYGQKAVVVIGGDQNMLDAMTARLIESGVDERIINVIPLPSQTLTMGLQKGGDTFSILARISQPVDKDAYEMYSDALPAASQLYRITPRTEGAITEIPAQKVIKRGTGEHEAVQLGYSSKDLDAIRSEILKKYAVEGYTYTEMIPHIAVPDGLISLYNTMNGKGDNRDTSYLSTPTFTFNSDEDFVVIYGVNHTQTRKAIYSNAVLYGASKLNGVASVYDEMYLGSADKYLIDGHHDSNYYYVYKLDRHGVDPYSIKVEYSTGNEKGIFYGMDNDQDLILAFRAYIEEATGVGPDYSELIYDRAIVFHKTAE